MEQITILDAWKTRQYDDDLSRALENLLSAGDRSTEAWRRLRADAVQAYLVLPVYQRGLFVAEMRRALSGQIEKMRENAPQEVIATLDMLFGPFSPDEEVIQRATAMSRIMPEKLIAEIDKLVLPTTTWNADNVLALIQSNKHAAVYLLSLYLHDPTLFAPMTPEESLKIARQLIEKGDGASSIPMYVLARQIVARTYGAAMIFSPNIFLKESDYDALIEGEKKPESVFPEGSVHVVEQWARQVISRRRDRLIEFIDQHNTALSPSTAHSLLQVIYEHVRINRPDELQWLVHIPQEYKTVQKLADKAIHEIQTHFSPDSEGLLAFTLVFASNRQRQAWQEGFCNADLGSRQSLTTALIEITSEDPVLAEHAFNIWRAAILPSSFKEYHYLLAPRNVSQAITVMRAFAESHAPTTIEAVRDAFAAMCVEQYRDYLRDIVPLKQFLKWKEIGVSDWPHVAEKMRSIEHEHSRQRPKLVEKKRTAFEKASEHLEEKTDKKTFSLAM